MSRDDRVARIIVAALAGVLAVYLVWSMGRGNLPAEPDYPRLVVTEETTTTTTSAPSTTAAPTTTTAPTSTSTTLLRNVWDRVADCESGEWDENDVPIPGTARWDDRRGGYEGGLHFLNDTWLRAGGGRYAQHAYDATREQQIEIAQAWLARTNWDQWPVCSWKVGAR